MALIECPNCGKKISDSAEICIHCNFNIKNSKIEEKLKKSFSSIPQDMQKQYECEFCSQNKRYRKIYKFKANYKMVDIAFFINNIILITLFIIFRLFPNLSNRLDNNSYWTQTALVLAAFSYVIAFVGFIILHSLRKKLQKLNVIFYVEFAEWLKKNKQLELKYNFSKKEQKIYKILYPKGKN